jgi:HEAT repeat protein
MGLHQMKPAATLILTLLLTTALRAASSQEAPVTRSANSPSNHILFLMHTGNTAQALQEYQQYHLKTGSHDFELIEQMGLALLDQGYRSNDPEVQLLTLFGAGISTNEKALYILEDGLASRQPELELIALNFLSRLQNDRADQFLHRAMSSNYLLIRFEAASQLALKKDPKAVGQLDALMAKIDEELWFLFPELYASIGSPAAKKNLRKLLTHRDELVRIAAIHAIADNEHDDFLPNIRRLASHHEPAQQEACAAALGALKDEVSAPKLLEAAKSKHINVRLAALNALYQLGRHEAQAEIESLAKTKDPFAISLLSQIPGSENVLASLLVCDNIHARLNAAVALLEHGDRRCLPIISEILLKTTRDLAIGRIVSPGKSLTALRVIPSGQQHFKDDPVGLEVSLHFREAALAKSIELPEKDFLALANALLEAHQNDLVPALAEVLENHPTPAVIELLKRHQQKFGAPLIRNYCNLVLYRLKEPGPYADNLRDWVTKQQNIDLIRFRPLVPFDLRNDNALGFELTPQETSRLLVEAFESFVALQDDKGIDMFISVIQNGNPKNKYALIGLLMRAIQ